ncbi:methyltransferase [Agromyces sp. NPDC058104]|uniref:DUF7059 domain-containing protein n=1 Tax=Agromyces sp. NPDC058104 TaxID=3346342 RepID=UPI0036DD6280
MDPARSTELLARLADDLRRAGYTVDALERLWGGEAAEALHRGERVPARRVLDARRGEHGASAPLAALAELFVLGLPVPVPEVAEALATLGVDGAAELGLVRESDGRVSAALDLRPYAFVDERGAVEWWILSDLGELALGHALGEHHVLGVGGASTTLSGLMLPTPARRVLDLGTGCGIQAMHASRFADEVVATDISERALVLAGLNLRLNGVEGVELRLGSLFEPVAGERFDRIVSNPPFVITPRTEGVPEYDYRDGGMVGDALVEAVVRGAAEHLEPGGVAQLLANWEYRGDADGLERAAAWADGLEHWFVEREVQAVAEYAETWIRDGGTRQGTPEFDRLYDAWLDDFEARGVDHVGFGYVLLRRPDDGDASSANPTAGSAPLARVERRHGAIGSNPAGLGGHLAKSLAAHDLLAHLDDGALRALMLAVAADVTEERHHWPGAEQPTVILLRQGGGFGRAVDAGTALAAFAGAADGELPAGVISDAIAQLLEVDPAELWRELAPQLRELVVGGLLVPVVDERP